MTVLLEGTIRRFIGLSSDLKPMTEDGDGASRPLPPGSSFFETDTGKICRFDGKDWRNPDAIDETIVLLTAIYQEMHILRTWYEAQLINNS